MKLYHFFPTYLLACAFATPLAYGQAPPDSLNPALVHEVTSVDTLAQRADTLTTPSPFAQIQSTPPVAQPSVEPVATSRTRTVTLLIDFADVNAQYKTNQRHFRSDAQRTNYCCFDATWQPVSLAEEHLWFGPVLNVGGWMQKMDQGPAVVVNDVLLGTSLLARLDPRSSGPWVRADLGLSLLTISRRTTGMDYGYGAALRAGWLFSLGKMDWIVGMGTDMRSYGTLDMKPITAATLFAGVAL